MNTGSKPKKEDAPESPVPIVCGSIQSQITLNLDQSQLSKIAMTGIYWASSESFIGGALAGIYIQQDKKPNELVWMLDTVARQKALRERVNGHILKDRLTPYMDEYEYSVRNYKSSRNIYAHGLFATTSEGDAFITPKNQILMASEIDKVFEQSKYALFFAYWLTQIIHDHVGPPTWPQRPS